MRQRGVHLAKSTGVAQRWRKVKRSNSGSSITLQNPAHAAPLASARQHQETQKENQAGHSSERAVEGHQGEACWGSAGAQHDKEVRPGCGFSSHYKAG